MKIILASLLLSSLLACGGKKADTNTTPADPNTSTSNTDPSAGGSAAPTGDGTPCAQEVALVCPDGQVDACLKTPAEGDTHKCVAK